MNGLLLVPTLNRIELLKKFIDSYKEAESSVSTVLLVDEKDYAANEAGYKEIESLIFSSPIQIINTHEAVTMGDKLRFIYPKMRSIFPEIKWVGLLNDDHYIITRKWDEIAESLLDGKNMLSTNDGFWNVGIKVCGLTAWSLGVLDAAGFPIYPPGLQHLYIDDLWKAIGESSGCWVETMKINIEHRHVLTGKMQADATTYAAQTQDKYVREEKVFREFMEKNFKDVVLRIVSFRNAENLEGKFI